MKKYFKNKVLTVSIISSLSLLSACSNTIAPANVGINHRTKVQMIRLPYMIDFKENIAEFSKNEKTNLQHFLLVNKVGYGDELSMDFALLADGELSKINQKRIEYIAQFFKSNGIVFSAQITPYGDTPKRNQARLLVSRYVATPPTCGDHSEVSSANSLPDIGCSIQAHLGLMVANPRDLINPAQPNSSDTDKAVEAVKTYKTNSGDK